MQLINDAINIKNVFKHELKPITTSLFDEKGKMQTAKSKSDFMSA